MARRLTASTTTKGSIFSSKRDFPEVERSARRVLITEAGMNLKELRPGTLNMIASMQSPPAHLRALFEAMWEAELPLPGGDAVLTA